MKLSLYEQLLGETWQQVDARVKAIHLSGDELQARGTFRISHGDNVITRLLGWMTLMPPAADAESVTLTIRRAGQGEEWIRMFGAKRLASYQKEVAGALLAESFGPLEIRFALSVWDSGIIYQPVGTAFVMGTLRLPLPKFLALRITASETATHSGDSAYISVDVALPILGRMISYQGKLSGEESH